MKKTVVWRGENDFPPRRTAKCLRTGIRPAKKFHRKVQPEARSLRVEPVSHRQQYNTHSHGKI
jgi:hypothetical protein